MGPARFIFSRISQNSAILTSSPQPLPEHFGAGLPVSLASQEPAHLGHHPDRLPHRGGRLRRLEVLAVEDAQGLPLRLFEEHRAGSVGDLPSQLRQKDGPEGRPWTFPGPEPRSRRWRCARTDAPFVPASGRSLRLSHTGTSSVVFRFLTARTKSS